MNPRGRGTGMQPDNRFLSSTVEAVDDGWPAEAPAPPATRVHWLPAKSILTQNRSPDIPFDRSVNPYQGCEHGCIYCYARPSHSYWGYSAGLDFETQLIAKPNAATLLRAALSKPGYQAAPLCLGANTDAYQPLERKARLTLACLEVLLQARHPLYLLTKNALIERDLDLLVELAQRRLVVVMISITTLDRDLARALEPRASQPLRRLQTVQTLADAGVPVGVLAAPMIPGLNDHELDRILLAAQDVGARHAGYGLLRLPLELKALFADWLQNHYPDRAAKVLHLLRSMQAANCRNRRLANGCGVTVPTPSCCSSALPCSAAGLVCRKSSRRSIAASSARRAGR
ncbi:PA0069 family radical SAM protein [Chitiniphilus purpureus]|uniref:PA0069 family radical SAM protein n=1 Tax=Chitiniphilus purpureus TaxID=2981137 RepID=A0ABY6DJ55_9NEIS|nr:PA0069 family radical SAM protein [Chitiniphilus sp. CD1]UXY14375.1 PA0069 family radical SAM protein [Chitiniphilus sp. CD1]